ncbi:MAG: ABC transporter ATP-binding protein [Microthrixaceae bacterium]|nr:ABC transporter ATP-binding protein [Microthrixaceae bacterium]
MPTEPCGLGVAGVSFGFADGTEVLRGVDLRVPGGALLALLGPSGCGKTTLLRAVAGLEVPASGSIVIGERVVTDVAHGTQVAPQRRGVAMVFQDWALLPHLDVAGNVTLGMGRAERAEGTMLAATLEMVGLEGLEGRMPDELSGGQQQRVAVGRALAQRPEVLLLDEPFSNLDPSLRSRVRREVKQLLVESGTTTVLVTHDREEALLMGDELAVMEAGRVLTQGDPVELHQRPPDRATAEFLGEVVTVPGFARAGHVQTVFGRLRCPGVSEGEVEVFLRPEQLGITEHVEATEGSAPVAAGTVLEVAFHGPFTRYRVALEASGEPPVEVTVGDSGVPRARAGQRVGVRGPQGPVRAWPAASGVASG